MTGLSQIDEGLLLYQSPWVFQLSGIDIDRFKICLIHRRKCIFLAFEENAFKHQGSKVESARSSRKFIHFGAPVISTRRVSYRKQVISELYKQILLKSDKNVALRLKRKCTFWTLIFAETNSFLIIGFLHIIRRSWPLFWKIILVRFWIRGLIVSQNKVQLGSIIILKYGLIEDI